MRCVQVASHAHAYSSSIALPLVTKCTMVSAQQALVTEIATTMSSMCVLRLDQGICVVKKLVGDGQLTGRNSTVSC